MKSIKDINYEKTWWCQACAKPHCLYELLKTTDSQLKEEKCCMDGCGNANCKHCSPQKPEETAITWKDLKDIIPQEPEEKTPLTISAYQPDFSTPTPNYGTFDISQKPEEKDYKIPEGTLSIQYNNEPMKVYFPQKPESPKKIGDKDQLFVPFREDDFLPGNNGIEYLNEVIWLLIENMNDLKKKLANSQD